MKALIFQRSKSATQSGRARDGQWALIRQRGEAQQHDPLTGWIGSGDTATQIELNFNSEAAAVAYAVAQGLDYEVQPLPPRALKLQAYADNFR